MTESFDLPRKLFYYTKETQEEGKRENSFLFHNHKIIQILLCTKCISLSLSFGGRHLTHCSKGDSNIKTKQQQNTWIGSELKLHLFIFFILYTFLGTDGDLLKAILFMTPIHYLVLFTIWGM